MPPLARLALLASLALLAGCPSSSSPTPRAATPDGLSCGQRLVGGAWRFTGFTPDQPLDATTTANLARLHGTVRLQFDGSTSYTTGAGIQQASPYRIDSDDGMSCRVLAPDPTGATVETYVRFTTSPNTIEVIDRRPTSIPGRSTMERVPVGS